VSVMVEGQGGQYVWVKLWDNRISKTFRINDSQSIDATFDLFNTLNTNAVIGQSNTNGPTYLQPNSIIPPRIFRLGGKFRF
jgi:hypothetical protein